MKSLFYIELTLCIHFLIISIILCFLKKGNKSANILFGLFFSSLAISNISFSLYHLEIPPIPHLIRVHLPFEFAIAPLLYLYFKALFDKGMSFRKIYWLHFIPTVYFLITELPFYFQPSDAKLHWFYNRWDTPTHHYLLATLLYLQCTVYIILVLVRLFRYNRKLKVNDSYSKILRKWVKELILVILLFFFLNIFALFIFSNIFLVISLISSVLYVLVLYKIFFAPEIFMYLQTSDKAINEIDMYPVSDISKKEESWIHEKLMDKIYKDKVYVDSNITLPGLAEQIEIPYHQLSYFINKKYCQNFNDFINSKRVEDVKERLVDADYSSLTIEAIGSSVGFNSKATFYKAFKKFTDSSPAQFKKNILQNRLELA